METNCTAAPEVIRSSAAYQTPPRVPSRCPSLWFGGICGRHLARLMRVNSRCCHCGRASQRFRSLLQPWGVRGPSVHPEPAQPGREDGQYPAHQEPLVSFSRAHGRWRIQPSRAFDLPVFSQFQMPRSRSLEAPRCSILSGTAKVRIMQLAVPPEARGRIRPSLMRGSPTSASSRRASPRLP